MFVQKKTFIQLLLSFMGILVIGLGIGYYVGSDNILDKNENNFQKESSYTDEELDAIGQYLWYNKTSRSLMALNGKEENIDHLTMENLITITIDMMNYDEYQVNYCDYNKNCSEDYYEKALIKTDVIANKFKYLFGSNKKLEFKNEMKFPDSLLYYIGYYYDNCRFEDELYICNLSMEADDSDSGYNYFYGKAKNENDTITLTIYGYSYIPNYDIEGDINEYKISSSNNKNIGVISRYNFEIFLDKFEKEHLNEMDVYEVIYKKEANGNYYWYQTNNLNK